MKKFIFSMIAMFMLAISTVFAQNVQTDYAGSAKFTDNWGITVQGGVMTPFNDFFKNGSTTPSIVIGVEKYLNPWLGVELEGRTYIGTGENYNLHTAFDAVNVSGHIKFNVLNIIKFNGTRRFFEPVVYTGLGWGHSTCSSTFGPRNYMTYRAGTEFNFNLGKEKAWGIIINPSVVWGDINNFILKKNRGNFELTAGVVYRFKNSNGKHTFTKAHLYDASEVAALNARIAELEARKPQIIERIVESKATNAVAEIHNDATYAVTFEQNSAVLTDVAKSILDKVPTNSIVDVTGSTSPEGTVRRNTQLAQERAQAIANYLTSRGVRVNSATGGENGRVGVVIIK